MLTKSQVVVVHRIAADLPLINADAEQLWRVFENLIGNALKYNPSGFMCDRLPGHAASWGKM
jgi:signal transduction histidine kinase